MSAALEIAVDGVADALVAASAGADRIELCATLAVGGVTPSHGTIAAVRARVALPLFVLIRERPGDFIHDQAEIDAMRRDIAHCRQLGCDGVVIGALTVDGEVDVAACTVLIEAAGTLAVTFHRAFDATADRARALEAIVALGCTRVLTSGGAASALEGAQVIARDVQRAAGRIGVVAAAGVHARQLGALARLTGADQFHASARAPHASPARHRNPALLGLEADRPRTSANEVRALRRALEALGERAQVAT